MFDLGWTPKAFGDFDVSVKRPSREASKAERIGKKYQWIAFHEILACIADHYQYLGNHGYGTEVQSYEGAWQGRWRDLDPSSTIRSTHKSSSWDGYVPSWWAPRQYDSWGEDFEHADWIQLSDDIPDVRALLNTRDSDGMRWLNLYGFFSWRQAGTVDVEPSHTKPARMLG